MIAALSNRRGLLAMVPALATVPVASVSGAEVHLADLFRKYEATVARLCATEDARDDITFGTDPHSAASRAHIAALSAEVDRLHEAMKGLENTIGGLRATTAEAVRMKAQFWKRLADGDDLALDPVLRGLINDLCREQVA